MLHAVILNTSPLCHEGTVECQSLHWLSVGEQLPVLLS